MNSDFVAEILRATGSLRAGDQAGVSAVIQSALAAAGLRADGGNEAPRAPDLGIPARPGRSHRLRRPLSEVIATLASGKERLGLDGKLNPKKFGDDTAEMKGQKLFFGKARCAECHPAPYYTDNSMHDLQVERFYKSQTINGLFATKQGPIKTFPLRGIKESPPYLHDGRLLTLDDTVEFFNLVLELKLTEQEKKDLVAFMYCL